MFLYKLIIITLFSVSPIKCFYNLACNNYFSYMIAPIDKINCYYNPDIFANSLDILRRHVGNYGTYKVTTEDGYILTLFRIPKKNPKGVVILQHPVTTDSMVWIGQNNESLAFQMSEAGYDVWLPNHRGTMYSRGHVNPKIEPSKYWDFSFHEIGLYDYSTIITFIKNQTGRNDMIFVGHSMSTTSSVIYAALKPEEAKQSIKVFVQMSPTVYFKNIKSPLRFLAPFIKPISFVVKLFNIYSLFEYYSIIGFLMHLGTYVPIPYINVLLLNFLFGWTLTEFDPNLVRLVTSMNPRGSSTKTLYHYAQAVNSGAVVKYDYGKKKNLQLYNTASPPEYPIENIQVPMYLMYSTQDTATAWKDVEHLYRKLPEQAKIYGKHKISGINHIEFHYGRHRQEKLYNPIYKLLDNILI